MESELTKFRQRKQLEQKKEEIKDKVTSYLDSVSNYFCNLLLPNPTATETPPEQDNEDARTETIQEDSSPKLKYLRWTLMLLTWLMFYVAFLKVEFGAVFFAVSLLIFIYRNTGTIRRKEGEVSAYSVFNKECEAIKGSLKPEDLERSLLYRP